MSDTKKEDSSIEPAMVLSSDADLGDVAERLIDQAKNDGIVLTGVGGLLTGLVQQFLQASLEAELTDHLAVRPTLSKAAWDG